MRYRFAEYTLDTETESLTGPSGTVALRGRTFQLLRILIEHAPALVGRDQILDLVWGHDALSPNILPQTISEIRQALGDSAQAPHLIETRHRRGYRLMVPVERIGDEVERTGPAGVGAASVAVRPEPSTADGARARAGWRPGWMLGTAVAAVAAIALAVLLFAWQQPGANDAGEAVRPALAIVGGSSSGGPDWLPDVGAELLSVALGADDRLQLLRADGRHDQRNGPTDSRWQVWLREVLGADYALTGVWRAQDDQLSFAYSLLRLADGRIVYSGEVIDSDLARLCREVAVSLRRNLRLIDPADAWLAELPAEAAARDAYYRGLAALGEGRAGVAVVELRRAMTDRQAGDRVRLALASAYRRSGDLAKARETFQSVLEHGERLPVGERLRLEAEAALVDHRPADAAASLRALHRLLPDDTETGLALLDAQIHSRQVQAAANTLASLKRLSAEPDNDPRWLLAQSRLAHLQHDAPLRRDSAQQALDLAHRYGRQDLVVAAELELAQAQRAEGALPAARDRLEALLDAELTPAQAAEVQAQLGSLWRDLGDFDQSARRLSQSGDGFAELGNRAGELRVQVELHIVESERGHSEESFAKLQALEPRIAELGDAMLLARYFNTTGVQAVRNNRIDEAERYLQRAATEARRAQQPSQEAGAYTNLAQAYARNRRIAEAVELWQRATTVFRESGDRMGEAITLSNLAAASGLSGDPPARAIGLNQEALALFRELGAEQHLARTSFNLALAVERQGELREARTLLEESLAAYRGGAGGDPVLHVGAALVRVRLAMADVAGASELLDSLAAPAEAVSEPLAKSHVEAARGQLAALAGELDAARGHHRRALQLREQANAESWSAQSELDLLHLDLQAGRPAEATRAAVERIAVRQSRAGQPRDELRARLIEVAALLRLDRHGLASEAIERAQGLLAQTAESGAGHELDRLRILADAGPVAARQARMAALAADVERAGFATLAERCRLDALAMARGGAVPADRQDSLRTSGLAGLLTPVP